MNYSQVKSNTLYFLLLAFFATLPGYVIRSNFPFMEFFYHQFTTYYGDLWYCWNNYLSHGFPYPREYPSGIQALFRLLFLVPGVMDNYPLYMAIASGFLVLCAIAATGLLYRIRPDSGRLIRFWLLAPSFLYLGLMNVDFACILTIVAAYYAFIRRRFVPSAALLGLGTTIKVFPIFLLPVFWFSIKEKRPRGLYLLGFMIGWLAMNIPFMLTDWNAWLFPFVWQIQENYARTISDLSWTWTIFQLFNHFGYGSFAGKVSLLLFAGSYFYFIRKYWHLPLSRKLTAVIILFLLTDRVYSAQYNLYLLPFLVILDYRAQLKYFYLFEIPDLCQSFFMFYFKEHAIYLQLLLLIKYFALIMLLRDNWRALPEPVQNKHGFGTS